MSGCEKGHLMEICFLFGGLAQIEVVENFNPTRRCKYSSTHGTQEAENRLAGSPDSLASAATVS